MKETLQGRLLLTGVYRDGSVMVEGKPLPFRLSLHTTDSPAFVEIRLRLVVRLAEAEELTEALVHGRVEVNIENIPVLLERA